MANLFGPLDALLRTLVAFALYFVTKAVTEAGFDLPFLANETLSVAAGLLISGLASAKVWRLPSFTLTWDLDGRPVTGSVVQMRIGDSRSRRLLTHNVMGGPPSLLSKWVLSKLAQEGVTLRLTTTNNVFRMVRDAGNVDVTRADDGFAHPVVSLGRSGLLTTIRMEWSPISPAMPVTCPVSYTLVTDTSQRKWLLRLVLMNPKVETIELTR